MAIRELLHLGKNAVYRRLRGDIPLSAEEFLLLAKAHHISLDDFVSKTPNTAYFNYDFYQNEIQRFDTYLDGIHANLERLGTLKNPLVYYASAEIPIFYYCLFPEIISFKLYVWGHSVWEVPFVENRMFSFDLISPDTLRMTDDLYAMYSRIPSIEFWSQNIVDFTLSQIEYHIISGRFTRESDALLLCDALMKLCEHLQAIATYGKKIPLNGHPDDVPKENFTLYHNEMVYTNNTILVDAPSFQQVYTAFGNPNFLRSSDNKVTTFAQNWFNKMQNRLERISVDSEKSRARFFNVLKRKITHAQERIQVQIDR